MGKELGLSLCLMLLFCYKGNTETENLCPAACQCFMSTQVLCADERMASLPQSISRQVKDFIVMTTAVSYVFPNNLLGSPQLTRLIFFNNALRSIHSQAFENLTELEELEISGNPRLEHLFLGTFSKLGNLTKLLLNYNRFKTVLPGMFDSLQSLRSLQLKGNNISHLPTFLFVKLHNLNLLDLSLNSLEEVTKQTFFGLDSLNSLKINNNLLRSLSFDTFYGVSHLTELSLEGNKIAELPDNIFSGLSKLKELNLRRNVLTTFGDKVFGIEASNLKELNLKGNRLVELSSISSLTSLTDLILSSNQLSTLPDDIFRNVTALENLDLSENRLTLLPETIFNSLFSIRAIDLHKNNLHVLDAQLFKDQQLIQQLYMSENQLQTLPLGLFDHFGLQHMVRLHGNPWKCDCNMWYVHDWVLKNSQDVEMLDRMLCESPDLLKRHAVVSVGKDQLVCQTSKHETHDLGSCILSASNDTMTVKCQVQKCSPLMVRVQFLQDDGTLNEHVLKMEWPEHLQCSNMTNPF
ncbi:carboxypeptidase N subunit 2 [Thalassophryne amazonica]|uniref:carboxypeptidase N subunit 2 n=1 Tax=Thalassophryne amazonica TaxID=390379 RepID=UPI00147087CC|nr:carboxypeptidase N subunit 2 [Thalassophryne amazonica]